MKKLRTILLYKQQSRLASNCKHFVNKSKLAVQLAQICLKFVQKYLKFAVQLVVQQI